jgi:FkbM family methyltransferase
MLQKNHIALDIGANLGLMSYHLAKNTKETFAFEPMPNNYKVVEKVKAKYNLDNLHLLTNALGNENKSIQLVLPEVDGVKKQGLSHVVDAKMTEFNDGSIFETECLKLDDQPELKNKKIEFVFNFWSTVDSPLSTALLIGFQTLFPLVSGEKRIIRLIFF